MSVVSIAAAHLATEVGLAAREAGDLFIGKAREKAMLCPSAFVNDYYFCCVDRDFGPFFIKLCSYFPYNGKVCLNGHEYVKRQLEKRGVAYEALDNGILSCEDPKRLQRICDGLALRRATVSFASGYDVCRTPSAERTNSPATCEAGAELDDGGDEASLAVAPVDVGDELSVALDDAGRWHRVCRAFSSRAAPMLSSEIAWLVPLPSLGTAPGRSP